MEIAPLIDHTILKPDTSPEEIKVLCQEAQQLGFAAVCVPPYYVSDAAALLENSPVLVSTVIGFPHGYSSTAAKVEEIKRALDDGAREIDVMINLCALRKGAWNFLRNDIESMTRAAHLKGKTIKVILETGLLNEAEIQQLCQLCAEIEVDFVKTSTGFNGPGATVETVQMLRRFLPPAVKIKASGGIRTLEQARALVEAGAQRIGCSRSVELVRQAG